MPIRCGTAQPLLICKKEIWLSEFKCWSEVRWLQRHGPGYDPQPMVSISIVPGNDNRIILITVMQHEKQQAECQYPKHPKAYFNKNLSEASPRLYPTSRRGALKVRCSGHLSFAVESTHLTVSFCGFCQKQQLSLYVPAEPPAPLPLCTQPDMDSSGHKGGPHSDYKTEFWLLAWMCEVESEGTCDLDLVCLQRTMLTVDIMFPAKATGLG